MNPSTFVRRVLLAIAVGALGGTAQAALHDRGGGLIYDDVLNITWLQDVTLAAGTEFDDDYYQDKLWNIPGYDVNADGLLSWYAAMAWVDQLVYYDSVRDVYWDDWRLPRVEPINGTDFNLIPRKDGTSDVGYNVTSTSNELSYMYYVNLGNIGQYDVNGVQQTGYGLVDDPLDPNDESLFINLKKGIYWTETLRPDNDTNAWDFRMTYGNATAGHLGYTRYAWAVRDGDVLLVPEADTWMMLLAGLGLVGFAARRRLA